MSPVMTRGMRGALCALVCIAALGGCSNFRSSKRLDMGPFAENTSSMLAQAEAILQPLPYRYLREYHLQNVQDPRTRQQVDVVRGLFRGIGLYSLQVVSLNASRLSDRERAGKLGDYFAEVLKPITDAGAESQVGLTRSLIDSTLVNVRNSPTFMAAIDAADPLVYAVVTFGIRTVDRVGEVAEPVFEQVREDVQARYAETRWEVAKLDSVEARDVNTYLALQDYRLGKATRDSVVALDPMMAGVLKGRDELKECEQAQETLRRRLAATDATRAQLLERIEDYDNKIGEVLVLDEELKRRVRVARLMFVYWLRAHRNLAQGVQVPPAINVGSMVSSSAKKAAGAIVP